MENEGLLENFSNHFMNYEHSSKEKSENLPKSLQYRKFFNWMSFLDPNTPLKKLSLPGSLNSAIYNVKFNELHYKSEDFKVIDKKLFNENFQQYNIISQLFLGIRFFSFTCKMTSNNSYIFCMDDFEGISLFEGLKLQMSYFFENFNNKKTEFSMLFFEFDGCTIKEKEALKKEIVELLEINTYGLKAGDFSFDIPIKELRKKNVRYILIEKDENQKKIENENDFFLSSNKFDFTNFFKKIPKLTKNQENNETNFSILNFFLRSFDLTPIFFEKTYGNMIYQYLDKIIVNFSHSDNLPNVFMKANIEQNLNFVKNVILLNQIKGLMNFNEYLALIFQTSDESFEEYSKNFNSKNSGCKNFTLGIPHIPNSISIYNKKIEHKVYFESLLTTCFTRREEKLKIEAPHGYIISFVNICSECEDKTNKLKFIITEGWVLENSISIKVKSLKNFTMEIKCEAIKLNSKIFYGEITP